MTQAASSQGYVLIVGDPRPDYTRSASLKRALGMLGFDVRRSRERKTRPVAVLVPYPGWFFLLQAAARARLLRRPLVFDYFISLTETRGIERKRNGVVVFGYRVAETLLVALPDVLLFDTPGSLEASSRYCLRRQQRRLVVPITTGIGEVRSSVPATRDRLAVLWYGTFNELHGAPVIADALRLVTTGQISFTAVGGGRLDWQVTWPESSDACEVRVLPAQPIAALTELIAEADVVLGVFGGTGKADHVIPNKVVDGLGASRAVVTQAATEVRDLAERGALLVVPPRDPAALAEALEALARERGRVQRLAREGRRAFDQRMSLRSVAEALDPVFASKRENPAPKSVAPTDMHRDEGPR